MLCREAGNVDDTFCIEEPRTSSSLASEYSAAMESSKPCSPLREKRHQINEMHCSFSPPIAAPILADVESGYGHTHNHGSPRSSSPINNSVQYTNYETTSRCSPGKVGRSRRSLARITTKTENQNQQQSDDDRHSFPKRQVFASKKLLEARQQCRPEARTNMESDFLEVCRRLFALIAIIGGGFFWALSTAWF
jgi:hypothetical protein